MHRELLLCEAMIKSVFIGCVLVLFGAPLYAQTESTPAPNATSQEKVTIATGFFVSDAGHLVTALHAITNKKDLSVLMPGKRRLPAELLKSDPVNDLALLKISAITPYLYLSHSDGVPPGMDVVTIGYPQVFIQGLSPKITRGIVNSPTGMRDDPGSFQFSAEVQRGNSGGPLIGPGGTVVGVVRSKLDALKLSQRTNDLTQNVNFATKSSRLLPLLKDVRGIPTTRAVDPDAPLKAARIYAELRDAIVPVIVRGADAGAADPGSMPD
jgi:serine protease Do